ncbi:alpha/beta-hydrolase [Imleria badia]|nr:alpha/beta-hydrolase [Imleria badia]
MALTSVACYMSVTPCSLRCAMTPGPISVFSKVYAFDPRPRFPLRIVAKRYWIGELGPEGNDHDTFFRTREDFRTLVFIHGLGCHKEHWEPTVERLFEHEQASTATSIRFRDMWSLDLLNHGDSAILNEEVLRWGYDIFSWEDHARGVHAFLAGLGTGVDVDFSKRRLALVGHSIGSSVLTLTPTYYPLLKISSLHLIEPYLAGEKGLNWSSRFAKLSATREDTWPSGEAAYQALRARRSFLDWDDRILKIFVTYGLPPLPTAEYPEKTDGVTLKCTRRQQAVENRLVFDFVSNWYLPYVLKEIPTHIMFGSSVGFFPYDLRQEALHVASGGISNFASATTVPKVGHMMLETHPNVVADVIWKQLSQSHARSHMNNTVAAKL